MILMKHTARKCQKSVFPENLPRTWYAATRFSAGMICQSLASSTTVPSQVTAAAQAAARSAPLFTRWTVPTWQAVACCLLARETVEPELRSTSPNSMKRQQGLCSACNFCQVVTRAARFPCCLW